MCLTGDKNIRYLCALLVIKYIIYLLCLTGDENIKSLFTLPEGKDYTINIYIQYIYTALITFRWNIDIQYHTGQIKNKISILKFHNFVTNGKAHFILLYIQHCLPYCVCVYLISKLHMYLILSEIKWNKCYDDMKYN